MRVVIVGAGLLGVSTAYFLSGRGIEVVVLDRQPGPGRETSFANGGMLTPSQADPWNAPGILAKLLKWIGRDDAPVLLRPAALPTLLSWGIRFLANSTEARFRDNLARNARLAAYSLATLRGLRARVDLRYDASTGGTVRIFREPASLHSALRLCAVLEHSAVRWQALTAEQLVGREPALGPVRASLAGGIHYPDDEAGDAFQYCEALATHAARGGVEFRYDCPVLGFDRAGAGLRAARTPGGSVEADRFVLAAGSWSPGLARAIGLRLPVQPVKGYSLSIDMTGWEGAPRLPVVDEDSHIAATPLGRRLRVAGTAEFDGFNVTVDPGRIRNLARCVADFYPASKPYLEGAAASAWAGLRPYSCDGVPILGRSRIPNLYLNTGHGHLGWTMATGSGKLVADLIRDEMPELDIAPYSVDRF